MDLTCFNWVQIVKKSDLPANAKYLALYLSTFMNAEHDIAWPSLRRISDETSMALSTVQKYLSALDQEKYLVKRSAAHAVKTKSGVQMQNEYTINIPEKVYRETIQQLIGVPTDGLRCTDSREKVYREPVPNNNKNNNRSNNGRFTPPSLEQVSKYCRDENKGVDPEQFVNFYEAKGWMIGKNKMKSWKHAIATWEKRNKPAITTNDDLEHWV